MNFTDKVIIITGTAHALGQKYSRQFAHRGITVNHLRDCTGTLQLIKKFGKHRFIYTPNTRNTT